MSGAHERRQVKRIKETREKRSRFNSKRVHAKLRSEGLGLNYKLVWHIWRKHDLTPSSRLKRKKMLGFALINPILTASLLFWLARREPNAFAARDFDACSNRARLRSAQHDRRVIARV